MNNENSTNNSFEHRPVGGQDGSSYQSSGMPYQASGSANTHGDSTGSPGNPGNTATTGNVHNASTSPGERDANPTESTYRINYGQAPSPNTSRFPSATFDQQTSHYPPTDNYPTSNGPQTASSGTGFYGSRPGASAGYPGQGGGQGGPGYQGPAGNSAYPSSNPHQFHNGYSSYPGPWVNAAHGGTVPPTGTIPGQKPHREKRRWSTALLGLTAAFSMLFGGVIGSQLDTIFGSESSPTQAQDSQPRQNPQAPQTDPGTGQNIPGQQGSQATGLDAGSIVDSAPGVVLVNTHLYYGAGAGTGMIISSDGLMITNYHVVSGSEDVQITISDTGETYTANVLGHDATHDIALLQIEDAKNLETVKTNTKKLQIGDEVSAVGNGSGQGYLTQLDGSILALNETITATDAASPTDGEVLTGLIVTDADVVPGYSGGPLFNSNGEVVGVTTAASRGVTTDQVNGYAVPISTALDIADQIKSDKPSDTVRIGKNPALGVTIANGTTSGARIVEVLEGSAANQAGIVPDDTIIALDGTPITTSSMLSGLVKEYEVGDVVTLSIVGADGTQRDVQVTLAESTVN